MVRAAVLIGVQKTGTLPLLPGVVDAVGWMSGWLKSQQVDDDRISIVTDEARPVNLQMVKDAIDTQLKDDVEQIIVYFSGHGVNLRYSEYWLLSGAPKDTQAAVNLDGSVALARQCGVPHVIFISDACRTAPEGVQAQAVTGGEIFPNLGGALSEAPVDVFFACALGRPALEIPDSSVSSKAYCSAFTKALVAALSGERPTVLEHASESGQPVGIVRPRPLGTFLRNELPKVLQAAQISNYTQLPYARITSDADAWLAKVPLAGESLRRVRAGSGPPAPAPRTLDTAVQSVLGNRSPLQNFVSLRGDFAGADLLVADTSRNLEGFGPDHFETQCGFKVRGASIADVFSPDMRVEVVDADRSIVRAHSQNRAAQVMLVLQDESSVVLPAIPEFVCGLTFEDGELADVAYEPSQNNPIWSESQATIEDRRALRAIIASSARLGVFRLDRKNAGEIARRIRYEKAYDPTMAIFAAYGFTDLRMQADLQEMYLFMRDFMRVRLFDVAMLARQLNDPAGQAIPAGRFPLLAQGWSLLTAFGVEMSGPLGDLQRHLKPSLWTYFGPQGTGLLRSAFTEGFLR